MFIRYFIGAILLKKSLAKSKGFRKDKEGGWPYLTGGGVYAKGVEPSAHYGLPLKTFSVGTSAILEEINKKT